VPLLLAYVFLALDGPCESDASGKGASLPPLLLLPLPPSRPPAAAAAAAAAVVVAVAAAAVGSVVLVPVQGAGTFFLLPW